MINNNTLSEIGDVLVIYSQVIVNADINISSFNDVTYGENSNRFFDKKFRYSLDGMNYSNWEILNNTNLQQINGNVFGFLFFEFRYERVGSDDTGILEFINIELNGNIDIQIVQNTSTMESIFSQIADNDFYTMSVRNNILRKIYHHGILPKFIERGDNTDDTDFISFWSAVSIFLSYFSTFSNNFENIIFKREYLAEYLRQYNIQLDEKEIIYQHLYFISTNLFDEIRKRGTTLTYKSMNEELNDGSSVQIDGEWLRIICRNHYDEFLLEVIQKEHSGFCLGNSSPMYNGTYFSKQLNKTEENTDDFVDLSKYTLMGNPILQNEDGKNCLNIFGISCGLGYSLARPAPPEALHISELITIDEEVDYELTFNFKRKNFASDLFNLKVGILCFNRNGVLLPNATQNIINNVTTNTMLNVNVQEISKVEDEWYSFRGILYSKGSVNVNTYDGRTNLNKGNNLKISSFKNTQKVEKIKICLYILRSDVLVPYEPFDFLIHNYKFRPLVRGKNILKNYLGKGEYDQPLYRESYIRNPQFLQSNTFCLNWRKNNSQNKSDNQVDNFIQNYLLPYQQKLVSIPLTPYVDDKQILI